MLQKACVPVNVPASWNSITWTIFFHWLPWLEIFFITAVTTIKHSFGCWQTFMMVFWWTVSGFQAWNNTPSFCPQQQWCTISYFHIHIAQISVSEIINYHLHSFSRNGQYAYYCLLRFSMIIPYMYVTSASLLGCCSWSPITMLNLQAGTSEICILDPCSTCQTAMMSIQLSQQTSSNRQWTSTSGTLL